MWKTLLLLLSFVSISWPCRCAAGKKWLQLVVILFKKINLEEEFLMFTYFEFSNTYLRKKIKVQSILKQTFQLDECSNPHPQSSHQIIGMIHPSVAGCVHILVDGLKKRLLCSFEKLSRMHFILLFYYCHYLLLNTTPLKRWCCLTSLLYCEVQGDSNRKICFLVIYIFHLLYPNPVLFFKL